MCQVYSNSAPPLPGEGSRDDVFTRKWEILDPALVTGSDERLTHGREREKIRAKNEVGDVVNVDVSYSLGTERGCW